MKKKGIAMKFAKFTVFDTKAAQPIDDNKLSMVINLDHIISLKPIRIMNQGELFDGYWVRLTNGKKYKAIEIPRELETVFSSSANTYSKKVNFQDLDDASHLQ